MVCILHSFTAFSTLFFLVVTAAGWQALLPSEKPELAQQQNPVARSVTNQQPPATTMGQNMSRYEACYSFPQYNAANMNTGNQHHPGMQGQLFGHHGPQSSTCYHQPQFRVSPYFAAQEAYRGEQYQTQYSVGPTSHTTDFPQIANPPNQSTATGRQPEEPPSSYQL